MNKLVIKSIAALLAISGLTMSAQEKQIEKANKLFEDYSFIHARETYFKVLEKGYESQDLLQKIADSYYFNGELDKAQKWYGRLYSRYNNTLDSEYLFRYAQSLKNTKDYSKADAIMKEFEAKTGIQEKRGQLFNEHQDYLSKIELQSGRFKIKNLSNINTEGSDFGPSFYGPKNMVFASTRDNNPLTKIVHEWNEVHYLDLYKTQRLSGKRSSMVMGLERFDSKINSKFHESTPVFTKDGKTVYFTRNNYTDGTIRTDKKGTTLLKIYKATLQNGEWNNITELPFNSNQYSVAHPALSSDESKLFFASDMPGTKGMSDIYYVNIEGANKYSDPVNLGDLINTEGRETFPFVSDSDVLFFASEGHQGLGGLDVFVSLPDTNGDNNLNYSAPINIGRPINSPGDDFSFIIDESTNLGYFTSNRNGGVGDDDVYSLERLQQLILKCEQTLKGKVVNSLNGEPIANSKVTFFDSNLNEIESVETDENGEYEITEPIACETKYIVRAEKTSFKTSEKSFLTTDKLDHINEVVIELEQGFSPIPPDGQELKVGDDLAKILQIDNIYFDLDKFNIRPDAEVELQKILIVLNEYPNMHLDIRSHTDSRANNFYNYKLSNNRAKSTVSYLVGKGIAKERLIGRGYGEIRLVNRCKDGVKCSEEEHQQNRRSEFIITKM